MKLFLSPFFALVVIAFCSLGSGGCSRESRSARSIERARASFEAGNYEKAKIEYLSILRRQRNNPEVLAQLGRTWMRQGVVLRALPFLIQARELGALSGEDRVALAFALMTTGQVAEVRAECESLLQEFPDRGEALLLLAEIAGTPDEANDVMTRMDRFPSSQSPFVHLTAATLARKLGRHDEVEMAVDRALAADPKSPYAHLAKAVILQSRNDFGGAEKHFQLGSEAAAPRTVDRLKFVDFKAQRGQVAEARKLAAMVVKEAPDYVPALTLEARMASAGREYDQSLELLERAFVVDRFNLEARLLQADVFVAKKELKQAVAVLQRLEQMYGGAGLIRLKLARTLMANGDLTAAGDVLRRILVKAEGKLEEEASLLLAETSLRSGNPAAAVTAVTGLMEKRPSSKAALYLVESFETQRRFDEAIHLVNGLLEREPDSVALNFRLAGLLAEAGRFDEARPAYEKVLVLNPKEVLARQRLVELDVRGGDTEAALQRVAGWRESDPDSPLVPFLEGRIRVARGEVALAEAALLETLKLAPDFPGASEILGGLYAKQNRLPEAVARFEESLARDPNDVRSLRLLAGLLAMQGEHRKAAESYERLRAALSEPNALVLNDLAALYEDHLAQPDRALELARQARRLQGSVEAALNPETRQQAALIADTLGWILYRRKEYAEASALLQEAVAVLGDRPEVQAHFGLAAAAMGQADTARAALVKATGSEAEYVAKAEATQRLALLEGDTSAPQGREALAALVAQTPDDPLVQLRYAEACERDGEWAEAAKAYAAALARNPELTQAVIRLADIHAGPLSEPAKALDYAKKARDAAPADARVAALLGRLVLDNGDPSWAYSLLREAADAADRPPDVPFLLGRAAYGIGRVDEARAAMEAALSAGLEDPSATEAKSLLALTAAPPPPAAVAEEVLARDPGSIPALMIRAASADRVAAVSIYRDILKRAPLFAPAQARLAAALVADPGSRALANDLAVKARESLPNDPDLAETLGQLAFHRRDHRYAVDLFTEASAVRPASAEVLYYFGLALMATEQPEKARETLAKALADGLSGAAADDAKRLLETTAP